MAQASTLGAARINLRCSARYQRYNRKSKHEDEARTDVFSPLVLTVFQLDGDSPTWVIGTGRWLAPGL